MSRIAATQENLTDRLFQPGTVLNRVLQEAPYFPRCSDNKTATKLRPREYAVRYPYMQVNRRGFVSWLIFDLDHGRAWAWEDAGLPAPNMIVQNRSNGHSHLYYAIVPVCTTEAARSGPIAYMKAIYEAFAAQLDADPCYSGPVAKTPGHRWWQTSELHNHVYELGDLAEFVEISPPRPFGKTVPLEDIAHSRHQLLFEYVRQYAYAIVNREREQGSFNTFSRLVEAFAHNRNKFANSGFAQNLPLSSIRATVKSVARWTWTHYTGSTRCHRGAMRLDGDLPLPQRQKLSAERTHQVRRQATESKVRAACRLLLARGESITQTAVAKIAKISRQTVSTYKEILKSVAPALVASLPQAGQPAVKRHVKYGTHQITGGGASGIAAVSLPGGGVENIDDCFEIGQVKKRRPGAVEDDSS